LEIAVTGGVAVGLAGGEIDVRVVTSGKTGRPENMSFSETGTGSSGWKKSTLLHVDPSTRSPSWIPILSWRVKAQVFDSGLLSCRSISSRLGSSPGSLTSCAPASETAKRRTARIHFASCNTIALQ